MNRTKNKKIVVLYHAECTDGFSGAWAAWKKFGDKASYTPVYFGIPIIPFKNSEVYMIDIIPGVDVVKEIIAKNKSVTAIDHHITNQPKLNLIPQNSFDLAKSGAVLAWEYFHPHKPLPTLLKYVQDMDLWQWRLPQSKEILAYLDLCDFDFNIWNKLATDMESQSKREEFVKQGIILEKYKKIEVNKIIKNNAQLVLFEGLKAMAVNSSNLHSRIGNQLVEIYPPIGIIWQQDSSQISVSLRSDGSVSVGQLAKKYGGGGHLKAAGFELPLDGQLPWKIIKDNDK